MSELIEKFRQQCRHKPKRVVFTDVFDRRILQTARFLFDEKLAFPLLLGTPSEIRTYAENQGIHTRGLRIRHPLHMEKFNVMVKDLSQLGELNGITRFDAENNIRDPLTMGAMLIRHKQADVCITGNMTNTSRALRTAIEVLGVQPNRKTVFGYHLLISPDNEKIFAFADCTVVPVPSSEQMAEISLNTAIQFKQLTGIEPRVAMLSFSTNKSADHELTQKVRQAADLAKEKEPSLILDGEIQFDAAIDRAIARRKAPNGRLEGNANIFIFPSLNAGNIAYKITQHIAGFKAVGPFLGGLNGNMHVALGESSTEDIINLALISSCL